MRKICNMELLAPKRVESFRSIREEEVSNLVKEMKKSEGVVVNLASILLPSIMRGEKIKPMAYGLTSRVAFGGKSEDQAAYSEMTKGFSEVATGFSLADLFPSIGVLQALTGCKAKVQRIHREMDRILGNVVRDHRDKGLKRKEGFDKEGEEEEEDLVDVLLRLQRQSDLEHPLSDSTVKATILDIFSAGSDTTYTTIEWAMSELESHLGLLVFNSLANFLFYFDWKMPNGSYPEQLDMSESFCMSLIRKAGCYVDSYSLSVR
ncbi:cytochrome P450 71D10 [Senna tora]|uniref:Cytochrome P450 71D10 n=1 Tax=Senna tora TaxID=362788 RepID=A0A834T8E2_9FABA|nr:cytochrome P450 71D10 [Senna tora]